MSDISFIVASVDRDRELQECISSIEKAYDHVQDVSIEILVVIQQAKQKKDIRIHYPEITRFYYIEEMGLSVARNVAIKNSTGEYLVFIDDDAAVKQNFIEVLLRIKEKYRENGAFCGRLIDPVQDLPFSVLFSNEKAKKLRRTDYKYFMGSAHVLTRHVIEKVGYYDERFGVGARYFGSEESDMFFRLKASGEQIIYLPDLVFFHPVVFPSSGYVYKYSYAVGAMLAKNSFCDKAYFPVYWGIAFGIAVKACIRILQKLLLKGVYKKKDERCHYAAVLKGLLFGVKDYLADSITMKGSAVQ